VSRLLLVRHGRAAAGWDSDVDPGLDDVGVGQAEMMAAEVGGLGPQPIVTSPTRRTRETAAPLERRWQRTARVEPRVGEIATPDGTGLADRGAWLQDLLGLTWPELGPDLRAWRDGVLEALCQLDADTVVVTHFVAINVAVGWATDDDRVVVVRPDNCSVTTVACDGARRRLTLVDG
jgi:broad specificity phosphatase PhoE